MRKNDRTIGCTVIFFITIIILFLLTRLSGCHYVISEGERVGVITKFSNKGLINKTWEGEAILGSSNVPGTGTIWKFSVDKEGPVKNIQEAIESGNKVHLYYKEYLISGAFEEDTTYRVTRTTK